MHVVSKTVSKVSQQVSALFHYVAGFVSFGSFEIFDEPLAIRRYDELV